jgi:hypothetical protein
MGKILNAKDVSLEFTPWTDKKCRITRLQIIEQLGGEIPHGEIDMILGDGNEIEKMITDQNTGTISILDEKKYGLSFKFDVYITKRDFYENILEIKFVCINNLEFFTKRITTTHQGGIKSTIESLYPGLKDIRIEPSGNDDTILYQNCETNYEMCKKLCYSYKDKSIFAFGWKGLLIKDMCGDFDSQGNVEPCLELETDRLSVQTQTYNLEYDKRVNNTSFSAWEHQEESTTGNTDFAQVMSKNCKIMMNYKNYCVLGTKSAEMMGNSWNNTDRMRSNGYSSIKIVQPDMPHYELGDVVIYKRALQEKSLPWKNYLITSNELFFSADANQKVDEHGFRFSWTSDLYGLDEGVWSEEPKA